MSKSLQLARSYLGKEVLLHFDRPRGSKHPKHGYVYPINYGYVPGTIAPDGGELDAYYLGTTKALVSARGICIGIIHRFKDDDDKLVVVPIGKNISRREILEAVNFQEQWFEHELIMKERVGE